MKNDFAARGCDDDDVVVASGAAFDKGDHGAAASELLCEIICSAGTCLGDPVAALNF